MVTTKRPAVARVSDDSAGHLYTGATTTLIAPDALTGNPATAGYREVLGLVPGANVVETRGAGFPSDGVGFRGLEPRQSVEVNMRQNGVNIAGDLYGYPEVYYSPPMEAVDRIEVVRGASGLEFGPQFGGVINFVVKDGTPNTAPTFTIRQTEGAYGLYDGFASVAGGTGHWTYYGFGTYTGAAGWRPNGNYEQGTGYGSLTYRANDALQTSLQLTVFRSRIHMAGGLDDAEFAAGPQQSYRARNWLGTPWNILEDVTTWHVAPGVVWTTTLSGMLSQRYLVWRNEDGGPQALDTLDPTTGQYAPREVEREAFRNGIIESRVGIANSIGRMPSELAIGVRLFDGLMHRQEAGVGTTGTNFTMHLDSAYATDMHFGTRNAALYVQEAVHVTDRLTITPGLRGEWLESSIHGFTVDDSTVPYDKRSQTFTLGGLGVEYALRPRITLYGNITQAYRPITYDNLIPFGAATTAIVDPRLHHSSGYTSDLGVRGGLGALTGDIDLFYMWYGDRVGAISLPNGVVETTNVADSRTFGFESSLRLDVLRLLHLSTSPHGFGLSVFDSFAWNDAHYTNGPYRGNQVEDAPPIIDRLGPTVDYRGISTTLTWEYTGKSYGDATNAVSNPNDPSVGVIPAFHVLDWSLRADIGPRYRLHVDVDNLANARYFTFRTGEYPGPGIIPSAGRTVSVGLSVTVR